MLAGELALQPQHVEAEILDVPKDRVLAVRVVGEQEVGRVGRAADQEVLAVDRQIEVAALAQIGEVAVGVAVLGDGADTEPEVGRIRHLPELTELQPQVVEVRLAEGVGPPQVGIGHRQLVELVGAET